MQAAKALSVSFQNSELYLVDHDGQPFVPMKPVVEGMGLDWKTQYRKLQSGRFNTCMVEMTIQLPGDTQRRAVSCLPLRKLTGWLMSIHPNKVKPELREGIIAYQNECDDALWAYWNDGKQKALAAELDINYTIDDWKARNPLQFQRDNPHSTDLMVCCNDLLFGPYSPCLELLDKLHNAGYCIDGAFYELRSYQNLLSKMDGTVRMMAGSIQSALSSFENDQQRLQKYVCAKPS